RAWPTGNSRSSPCSTIPRRGRGPGTTSTSSEISWRSSGGPRRRAAGVGPMPKRDDVRTAMVVGSGPIVIGQAAEFDYSGTQACRSLREEGVRVVLVNSNPATIQTDPETADAVYVEPLTIEFLEKVIAKERPQGILSGMGGQTALNLCSELADAGILQRHGVELLGTKLEAITAGENRERFASLMRSIGEPIPRSRAVSDFESARGFVEEIGYPAIVRALGVEGGCNIQFAVHPRTGEYRVIEVNPRVSRSSALASKATGYPIARIAAKIAIGLRLDEIPNPVTGKTLASFEPTLDYVV